MFEIPGEVMLQRELEEQAQEAEAAAMMEAQGESSRVPLESLPELIAVP